MSPSEQDRIRPEVIAIAIALASLWPEQPPGDLAPATSDRPGPWRLAGRRWERPGRYRWS